MMYINNEPDKNVSKPRFHLAEVEKVSDLATKRLFRYFEMSTQQLDEQFTKTTTYMEEFLELQPLLATVERKKKKIALVKDGFDIVYSDKSADGIGKSFIKYYHKDSMTIGEARDKHLQNINDFITRMILSQSTFLIDDVMELEKQYEKEFEKIVTGFIETANEHVNDLRTVYTGR